MQRPEIGRSPVRCGPAGYSGGPVDAGTRSCVDRNLEFVCWPRTMREADASFPVAI